LNQPMTVHDGAAEVNGVTFPADPDVAVIALPVCPVVHVPVTLNVGPVVDAAEVVPVPSSNP